MAVVTPVIDGTITTQKASSLSHMLRSVLPTSSTRNVDVPRVSDNSWTDVTTANAPIVTYKVQYQITIALLPK